MGCLHINGCVFVEFGRANGNKQGNSSNDAVADSAPADAIGLKRQGNDFLDKGDYNAAMECYIKAIEVYPKYDTAYYNLGLAKSKLGVVILSVSYRVFRNINKSIQLKSTSSA